MAGSTKTNGWGIDLNYQDAFGKWHDVPRETIDTVLEAMGADRESVAPSPDDSVVIVHSGSQREVPGAATILLETGETVVCERRLPADLPNGYHRMQFEGDEIIRRLIVSPGRCWLPEDLKTWGWAAQLYGARSRESWGIGDFGDLDRLAQWSASELGAGMMLVNPLSAASPLEPQQASPYFPSSRRFFNPLWLRIEWLPDAIGGRIPQIEELALAGRDMNRQRLIDRNKIFQLKMQALEILWLQFNEDVAFDEYCQEHGSDLDRFAVFCAIAEWQRSGWHSWPVELQHPASPEVARFAAEHSERIRFFKWIQWLLDKQLAQAARHLALMQDLPVGVDPDGADAWGWQDYFATGVAVGAPPDEFNTRGQNWGLPPFLPNKLRAAGYEPFVQTVRAAFRHGGGLRIDHVMGLFRLFWIPEGQPSLNGAYVRYNPDEMLAIVALESERARAYVVGEDLGTVEDGVREKLATHRILSYRLLWFEKEHPATYPKEALVAVTTHDLPTVAGLWTGADLKRQEQLNRNPNEESTAEIHRRLKRMAQVDESDPIEDVIAGAYRLLAEAPSRIVTASLDDAAAVLERPNFPATSNDENPNWSLALPMPIEELMEAKLPNAIAGILQRGASVARAAAAASRDQLE
ncbi:MAG TPA: 4-alpha-glucanotransferase [Bryobacteraceae bacterium]|jgi:4-alpha-glucanotransferase|nr:4-alpha-glucanotransferase [Bryobacteraceae bacterium]